MVFLNFQTFRRASDMKTMKNQRSKSILVILILTLSISCTKSQEVMEPIVCECGHVQASNANGDTTLFLSPNRLAHYFYIQDELVRVNVHFTDTGLRMHSLLFNLIDKNEFVVKLVPGEIPNKDIYTSSTYVKAHFQHDTLASLKRNNRGEISKQNYRSNLEEGIPAFKRKCIDPFLVKKRGNRVIEYDADDLFD